MPGRKSKKSTPQLEQIDAKLKIVKAELQRRKKNRKRQAPHTPRSSRGSSKRQKSAVHECHRILKLLKGLKFASEFLEAFDWENEGHPHYPLYCPNAMDFGTMTKKLNGEKYETIYDFAFDIHLIVSNALCFNGGVRPKDRGPVYKDAIRVGQKFFENFAVLVEHCEPNGFTRALIKIMYDIFRQEDSQIFKYPVPIAAMGLSDYLKVIKKPMDLGTIFSRIHKYTSYRQFMNDVNLVFDNCMKYNNDKTVYHGWAQKLKQLAQRYGSRHCHEDHTAYLRNSDIIHQPSSIKIDYESLHTENEGSGSPGAASQHGGGGSGNKSKNKNKTKSKTKSSKSTNENININMNNNENNKNNNEIESESFAPTEIMNGSGQTSEELLSSSIHIDRNRKENGEINNNNPNSNSLNDNNNSKDVIGSNDHDIENDHDHDNDNENDNLNDNDNDNNEDETENINDDDDGGEERPWELNVDLDELESGRYTEEEQDGIIRARFLNKNIADIADVSPEDNAILSTKIEQLSYEQQTELQKGALLLDHERLAPLLQIFHDLAQNESGETDNEEIELDIEKIPSKTQVEMYIYVCQAIKIIEDEKNEREAKSRTNIIETGSMQQQQQYMQHHDTNSYENDDLYHDEDEDVQVQAQEAHSTLDQHDSYNDSVEQIDQVQESYAQEQDNVALPQLDNVESGDAGEEEALDDIDMIDAQENEMNGDVNGNENENENDMNEVEDFDVNEDAGVEYEDEMANVPGIPQEVDENDVNDINENGVENHNVEHQENEQNNVDSMLNVPQEQELLQTEQTPQIQQIQDIQNTDTQSPHNENNVDEENGQENEADSQPMALFHNAMTESNSTSLEGSPQRVANNGNVNIDNNNNDNNEDVEMDDAVNGGGGGDVMDNGNIGMGIVGENNDGNIIDNENGGVIVDNDGDGDVEADAEADGDDMDDNDNDNDNDNDEHEQENENENENENDMGEVPGIPDVGSEDDGDHDNVENEDDDEEEEDDDDDGSDAGSDNVPGLPQMTQVEGDE